MKNPFPYFGFGLGPPYLGNIPEPELGGYKRVATIAELWDEDENEYTYKGGILFPSATASWGKVTHFAVFDSQYGGNLLWSRSTTPTTITKGAAVSISGYYFTIEKRP